MRTSLVITRHRSRNVCSPAATDRALRWALFKALLAPVCTEFTQQPSAYNATEEADNDVPDKAALVLDNKEASQPAMAPKRRVRMIFMDLKISDT